MSRPASTDWPMVGRNEELAAALVSMDAEGSAGVVLAGPAGVGKSRLAREVLSMVARAGSATTWTAATRATSTVPFGALISLLPERLPSATDQLALFRAVARFLVGQAEGRPLVFAVDDAHLLDEAGAGLVHQLAATARARFILTVRTGEQPPDPIRSVWKDGLAERLELAPLPRPEVGRLLERVLGGHVAQTTIDRLWSITGGNPLFLRELVLDTVGAGGFDTVDGVVLWRRPLAPGQRLDDLLAARLEDVSSDARSLAQLLALGEPLGLAVLERLGPPSALRELEDRSIVRVERQQQRTDAHFSHPLYGEVLRSQLRSLAGRDLRRRLAEALAEVGFDRRGDRLRLATLELDADLVPPPARALDAAQEANRACDFGLAERLARAALVGGTTAAAALALGEALNGQSSFADAEVVLATTEGLPASDPDRARIAEQRAEALHWGLGRAEAARKVLLEAERSIADAGSRQYVQAVRASTLTSNGRYQEGYAVAAHLLGEEGVDEAAQLHAVVSVGTALSVAGRTTEATALCDRMLGPALRRAQDVPSAVGWVVFQRLLASILGGRLDEAEELSRSAYAVAVAERDDEVRGALAALIGRIELSRGRLDRAEAVLREGAALLAVRDREHYRSWCLSLLAQVVGQRGEADVAADLMAEVDADADPGEVRVSWTDIEIGRAWASVAGGALAEARRGLFAAAARAGQDGMVIPEAVLLHEAMRAGGARASRVAGRLDTLADGAQSRFLLTWAAHARGVADADPAAISAAAEDFEAMGMHLLAAETWVDAAHAARAAGDGRQVRRAMARCEVLIASCPGARTPVLAGRGATTPLTQREREVAILAAQGLSSGDIAEELVVSVRTIDSHLEHAYRKLGVSRREDLAPLLGARANEASAS